MQNGSLSLQLHEFRTPLPWLMRLAIARDVAAALNFLHSSHPQVLHRDLKSCNVLLSPAYRGVVSWVLLMA